jgi:hypothetical protein
MTITEIAEQLNERCSGRPIGNLQQIRSQRTGKRLLTHNLFDSRSVFEDAGYAYHVGGRTEIQYNFGEDDEAFRYGIAFSLEPSRNLPDFTVLVPNITRFNEFLRTYPDEFADLEMWHYSDGERSTNYPPAPIPSELVRAGAFIFLGKLEAESEIDCDRILDLFDRLLPLYRFVEGDSTFPVLTDNAKFVFNSGCSQKSRSTTASSVERTVDVSLRHNELQLALFEILRKKYGDKEVGSELDNGAGARVDVVVRRNSGFWFYEIKTAGSSRGCIREALAQLIEYSLWPGAQEAERLIIVGEPTLDKDSRSYLARLNRDFNLPIEYQQLDMESRRLVCSSAA